MLTGDFPSLFMAAFHLILPAMTREVVRIQPVYATDWPTAYFFATPCLLHRLVKPYPWVILLFSKLGINEVREKRPHFSLQQFSYNSKYGRIR